MVVCRSFLAATGAHRLGASARTNRNVDPCRCPAPNEFCMAIDETGLLLNPIEDRLYLHRVGLFWCGNRHVDTMRLWLRASTRLSPNGSASKMRTLRPHRTSEHRARHHALVALAPHTARLRDYVTRRCTISRPQILVKSQSLHRGVSSPVGRRAALRMQLICGCWHVPSAAVAVPTA